MIRGMEPELARVKSCATQLPRCRIIVRDGPADDLENSVGWVVKIVQRAKSSTGISSGSSSSNIGNFDQSNTVNKTIKYLIFS
jgi:hypothetical protein